jgi:ribosomal protein S18 acetylase RimI-like enzyme
LRGYRLRKATEADLEALVAILDGAVAWLGQRGLDQWAGSPWRADELRPGLATGGLRVAETAGPDSSAGAEPGMAAREALLLAAGGAAAEPTAETMSSSAGTAASPGEAARAEDASRPVATMTLGEDPASYWRPADDLSLALYLSHLAVDRRLAGRGVGAWLLDEAAREAARRGKRLLRLDAWTNNTRLHDYYRRQGFRLVRIAGDRGSGALFERAVSLP